MIQIRKSEARGRTQINRPSATLKQKSVDNKSAGTGLISYKPTGSFNENESWLDSYHTFSFDQFHDPDHVHFRDLRVINEDYVKPGAGFPTHGHRDMEIITYVLEGNLAHQDSMGNGSTIKPGDVQRMSAGTGVTHSEFNHSKSEPVHLLQIWIFPERKNLTPGYEQREFTASQKLNKFCLVASGKAKTGAVKIHQDVELSASILEKGKMLEYAFGPKRFGWLQMARGSVRLNDAELKAGDGAAISAEKSIRVTAKDKSEILLFDLA